MAICFQTGQSTCARRCNGRSCRSQSQEEVVPEHGEEGVVLLHHGDAVLAAEVVGLAIGPVKPGDGLILVRPHPVTGGPLTVPLLSGSSKPELSPFSDLK